MAFYFIFLVINFMKINAFLIISMKTISADDCINKVKLENDVIFQNTKCIYTDKYEIIEISYEIGQKINMEVDDKGGKACSLKVVFNLYNIN